MYYLDVCGSVSRVKSDDPALSLGTSGVADQLTTIRLSRDEPDYVYGATKANLSGLAVSVFAGCS